MTPERERKFRQVVYCRQPDLTVVLENVHDPHNIGAVLRTCDAVGVQQIFVLYTDPRLVSDKLVIGKRTSSGARHWVDVHYYTDPEACFRHVRSLCAQVLATHLASDSRSLYELDLTVPTALVFGNEHEGVSQEILRYTDGNFIIPQVGMVQSLNISVACAVSLYEAFRQRKAAGYYDDKPRLDEQAREALLEEYRSRHESKRKGANVVVKRKNP
ncbi:MAG: tRNA (guanosine(18)-2'-O)-methyltransferase [Saprospiraceae bacterium]|jgi:tRNA (guanosine-2'-O-)-methyltransferase|nr:MAG: tRNA (guanosine(18)-2'-O)-methyltransferase [Saprospiraceae bacterium]